MHCGAGGCRGQSDSDRSFEGTPGFWQDSGRLNLALNNEVLAAREALSHAGVGCERSHFRLSQRCDFERFVVEGRWATVQAVVHRSSRGVTLDRDSDACGEGVAELGRDLRASHAGEHSVGLLGHVGVCHARHCRKRLEVIGADGGQHERRSVCRGCCGGGAAVRGVVDGRPDSRGGERHSHGGRKRLPAARGEGWGGDLALDMEDVGANVTVAHATVYGKRLDSVRADGIEDDRFLVHKRGGGSGAVADNLGLTAVEGVEHLRSLSRRLDGYSDRGGEGTGRARQEGRSFDSLDHEHFLNRHVTVTHVRAHSDSLQGVPSNLSDRQRRRVHSRGRGRLGSVSCVVDCAAWGSGGEGDGDRRDVGPRGGGREGWCDGLGDHVEHSARSVGVSHVLVHGKGDDFVQADHADGKWRGVLERIGVGCAAICGVVDGSPVRRRFDRDSDVSDVRPLLAGSEGGSFDLGLNLVSLLSRVAGRHAVLGRNRTNVSFANRRDGERFAVSLGFFGRGGTICGVMDGCTGGGGSQCHGDRGHKGGCSARGKRGWLDTLLEDKVCADNPAGRNAHCSGDCLDREFSQSLHLKWSSVLGGLSSRLSAIFGIVDGGTLCVTSERDRDSLNKTAAQRLN
mmetsp:Transcript_2311/g.5411  ORF Transcript_2311/g.5411 Transcript_2311/m.5411 type:complete len:626 (-) Transcript_2311:492-2369(-)